MRDPNTISIESYVAPPQNLRIAIVTETFPPEVNGVAMTVGRIVEGLVRLGHSVQLVRPRQTHEQDLPMPADGLDQILCQGIQIPFYKELRFGLPVTGRLVNAWQAQRPDIVHVVTEGPLGWSAVAAARALKLPITSSFHTNFHSYAQHYGMGLLKAAIERHLRNLHNRTDVTLVPTKALMQELQECGYRNVSILSRGVAIDRFSPTKRSQSLRRSWGAGPDDVVVIFVSRLAKEKNVQLVVSAFRGIQSRLPKAKLVFVGDGPMRQQLAASCPDAIFAGVRRDEDLAVHYASGDVFLFPSLSETFGNVVPEALASGLAVLSYAKASAQELIKMGENGILVPAGDELEFFRAAVNLAANQPQQQKLREAAVASVAHLGWDSVCSNFVETLLHVLAQRGHGALDQAKLAVMASSA